MHVQLPWRSSERRLMLPFPLPLPPPALRATVEESEVERKNEKSCWERSSSRLTLVVSRNNQQSAEVPLLRAEWGILLQFKTMERLGIAGSAITTYRPTECNNRVINSPCRWIFLITFHESTRGPIVPWSSSLWSRNWFACVHGMGCWMEWFELRIREISDGMISQLWIL